MEIALNGLHHLATTAHNICRGTAPASWICFPANTARADNANPLNYSQTGPKEGR